MGETAAETLQRWEEHGAVWRLLELGEEGAVVELCTCFGEPVDRLESSDPELLELLRRRPSSEDP
jgi:hypothetical protein